MAVMKLTVMKLTVMTLTIMKLTIMKLYIMKLYIMKLYIQPMPMPRFWRSAAMLAMSEMTIPNWLNNYAISDIVNIAVGSELYKDRSSSSRRPSCTARWPLEIPVYTLSLAARQHAEKSFATSLENYVPPGSRYKLGR